MTADDEPDAFEPIRHSRRYTSAAKVNSGAEKRRRNTAQINYPTHSRGKKGRGKKGTGKP